MTAKVWLSYGRFKDEELRCSWGSAGRERFQVPSVGDWIICWSKDADPTMIYLVSSTDPADWDEDGYWYFADTTCDAAQTIVCSLNGLDFDEQASDLLPATDGWRGVPRLIDGKFLDEVLDVLGCAGLPL